MRPEPRPFLAALLTGLLSGAQAQKLDLHPAVDVLATATTNASQASGAPRKDAVISVSPELSGSYVGPHARIEGRLRVDNVHFVRNSQPDKTLPNGELLLHTELIEQWAGVDAGVQSSQTQASLLTRPSGTPGATETYTTTQTHIAPFIEHAFNNDTLLKARLERAVTQSSEDVPGLGKRADVHLWRQALRLERQPVPLGGWLEWTGEETKIAGQAAPALDQKAARAGVSYALNDQFRLGLIAGRESIDVLLASQSETIRGMNLLWHPNERVRVDSTVERRFFGTGWKVDWSHRMPFLAWNLVSERDASTYASSLGALNAGRPLRDQLSEMFTTYNPDPKTRAGLVDQAIAQFGLNTQQASALDIYSLQASLRQSLQARFVLMGQRNTVTFAGGLNKTEPLALEGAGVTGLNGDRTSERYLDAQFSRRLTPFTSLNAGVRWGLANVMSANSATNGRSRNLIWRGALNTKLSSQATAMVGLRHQTTHSTQPNVGDESAMFVGLGYRY